MNETNMPTTPTTLADALRDIEQLKCNIELLRGANMELRGENVKLRADVEALRAENVSLEAENNRLIKVRNATIAKLSWWKYTNKYRAPEEIKRARDALELLEAALRREEET